MAKGEPTTRKTHLMINTIPSRDICVLRYVLEYWAKTKPDQTFCVFEDDEIWTYAETHKRAQSLGAALQAAGVGEGDHVVVWLPNGKECLEAYCALGYIGAVFVPVNVAYRGDLLAHVLDNADAKLALVHPELITHLENINTAMLETIVTTGNTLSPVKDLNTLTYEELLTKSGELAPLSREIEPWDTQAIIYTSGTTGASKGVLSSYLHNYAGMNRDVWCCISDDDRYLINMPMFHIGGCFIVYSMLCRGASIAMTSGFHTDTFWQTVERTRSTVVFLLGVMATFLLKEYPRDKDKDHCMKIMMVVPFNEEATHLAERFSVTVHTIFNMTEISCPIFSPANPTEVGYCGRPRDGVTLRVVDDHDIEVPPGTTGQLVIRTDHPWEMNHGYYKNSIATVEAWRNGWFHTGDAFRMTKDGDFFYVDRIKDAIRRRGENISSLEVESQVNKYFAVQECAAIAVPSEYGEDEVMIVLATKIGQSVDPVELLKFLRPRMAHFMIPRYIRILDELPKTPTTKIQKSLLRDDGITADTWDREEAGIIVRPEKLT
jgi:crotonobetaine/carnitine-CoA ligase